MEEKDITGKMIRTNIMHRRVVENMLENTGVYQGQHRILMELSKHHHHSQKELAIAMKVSTATIAIALKKLEKNGYINKIMDKEDNRLNTIIITEKGQKVVEDSRNMFNDVDKRTFQGFTDDEKEQFYGFLSRIENNIMNIEKEIKVKNK